jgi:hypothetical protein
MPGSDSEKQLDYIEDGQIGEKISAAQPGKRKPIILVKKNPWRKIFTYTHNWGGLLTTAYLLVLFLTGVFLNHRLNMTRSEEQVFTLNEQEKAAALRFLESTKKLAAAMEPYTKRSDYETIHIQRDGTADFLDRSGHKWTFSVDPWGESMVWADAVPTQPWNFLNKLHLTDHTHPAWTILSTTVAVGVIVVLVTGLLLVRWKALHVILTLAGVGVLVLAIALYAPNPGGAPAHGGGGKGKGKAKGKGTVTQPAAPVPKSEIRIPSCPTLG